MGGGLTERLDRATEGLNFAAAKMAESFCDDKFNQFALYAMSTVYQKGRKQDLLVMKEANSAAIKCEQNKRLEGCWLEATPVTSENAASS